MNDYTIHHGDALTLRGMESESVQCCITSPPYFGLRDYGTAKWEGGGVECDHVTGRVARTITEASQKQTTNDGAMMNETRSVCPKCGAVRTDSQIGLEPTPAEYVAALVDVFEEVRRVLKPDGTCWMNLGDSYNSDNKGNSGALKPSDKQFTNAGSHATRRGESLSPLRNGAMRSWGLKAKDLCGIPWRVAFALQDAGWWLRQDIIWSKPNPMPESVTDRCTKAHEYIFLLTKSAKYFYDAAAVREEAKPESAVRYAAGYKQFGKGQFLGSPVDLRGVKAIEAEELAHLEGRNKRSVWTVTTQSYSEAHFATFPPKLIEPMVLAGSREGDTILDPFNGSGTTGLVSLRHRRRYVGIELNPEYIAISEKRLRDVQVQLF
jgi:DNA modification methylase